MNDFQKLIRNIVEKIERELSLHHDTQMQLFQQNQRLQWKQDQLTMKQDQLNKLMTGERETSSLPHVPVLSSPRLSPGFSRRSSMSPAPAFVRSFPVSPVMSCLHPPLVWAQALNVLLLVMTFLDALLYLNKPPLQLKMLLIHRVCDSKVNFDLIPLLDGPSTNILLLQISWSSLHQSHHWAFPAEDAFLEITQLLLGKSRASKHSSRSRMPLRKSNLQLSSLLPSRPVVVSVALSISQPGSLFTSQPPALQESLKSTKQVLRKMKTLQLHSWLATALAHQSFSGVRTLTIFNIRQIWTALNEGKPRSHDFIWKSLGVFNYFSQEEFDKTVWETCTKSLGDHIEYKVTQTKPLLFTGPLDRTYWHNTTPLAPEGHTATD